jgi:hypothetical protein
MDVVGRGSSLLKPSLELSTFEAPLPKRPSSPVSSVSSSPSPEDFVLLASSKPWWIWPELRTS